MREARLMKLIYQKVKDILFKKKKKWSFICLSTILNNLDLKKKKFNTRQLINNYVYKRIKEEMDKKDDAKES